MIGDDGNGGAEKEYKGHILWQAGGVIMVMMLMVMMMAMMEHTVAGWRDWTSKRSSSLGVGNSTPFLFRSM